MEADEDGVTAKNTYGGPLLLRTVFSNTDETTYEYMYNAHGDVVTLISDGDVVATYCYDSFGNILEQTGEVSNSILYAGYQYDEETGLYYINARMYDPVTARFLQADTYLGNTNDPLSLNLYTYCLNNPHKYVDPSGHSVLVAALLVMVTSALLGAGMEYVSQKYIEKRDVINYDLIIYEGAFNAIVGVASMGMGSIGRAALRQTGKLSMRKIVRGVAWGAAFGMLEGAINNVGRQQITGTSLGDLDYAEIASSATFTGIIGGMGTLAGFGLDAMKQRRAMRKFSNRAKSRVVRYSNLLEDSNMEKSLNHVDVDVSVDGRAYQSGSKPIGATYEGTIYRSVNSKYDPLEMSQYTVNSNHRYTESGVPGLYFSSGEKIVKAELGNYDVFDFSNRTMYSYDVRLKNMLDVSNPSVRSQMGISLESIVGESYDVTHAVGRYAYSNGYNGIIAPSARADGGINIILFNAKGVK